MDTDEAIRLALADLPPDRSTTFARILRKSDDIRRPSFKYRSSIFEFVAAAHHHLTLEELRGALSVTPGDTVWNPSRLLNSIINTLKCCGSLLMVDEEGMTVRFVHSSVKQFLIDPGSQTDWKLTIDTAHGHMADDSKVQTPLHLAALFGNENAVKQLLCHSAVDANFNDNKGGTPLIAAIRFGQEAVCKALIKSEKVSIIEPNPKTDQTPLNIAALHSSAARTVEMLLQRQETLPSVRHRGNRTALQRAYEINNTAVVRVMLESHRVDVILEPWGPGDDTAPDHDMSLHNSLNRREDEMAMVIIESKRLDVNLQDRHGDTPLRLAVQYKSKGIALRFLEIDSIDINIQNASGNTALHTAAENDQVNVVRRMFEREELNANHQDKVGITPLHLAFRYNQHLVAKLLLDCQKVSPNVEDLSGQRPLEYSALRKSTQIIRLLSIQRTSAR
ncbi:hypothetical protein PoHVEF18_005516 [Penicillium ochrochloron]